ncbi:MAG: hypothetical protein ACR2OH_04305, partial [Microthrixaceae bacterium]
MTAGTRRPISSEPQKVPRGTRAERRKERKAEAKKAKVARDTAAKAAGETSTKAVPAQAAPELGARATSDTATKGVRADNWPRATPTAGPRGGLDKPGALEERLGPDATDAPSLGGAAEPGSRTSFGRMLIDRASALWPAKLRLRAADSSDETSEIDLRES